MRKQTQTGSSFFEISVTGTAHRQPIEHAMPVRAELMPDEALSEELDGLAGEALVLWLSGRQRRRDPEIKKRAILCLLANGIAAHEAGCFLSFPKRYGVYTTPKIYRLRHWTWRNILGAAAVLKEMGILQEVKAGFYDRGRKIGRRTRITFNIRKHVGSKEAPGGEYEIVSTKTGDCHEFSTGRPASRLDAGIILRDRDKRLKNYSPSLKTEEMRKNLAKINDVEGRVTLDTEVLDILLSDGENLSIPYSFSITPATATYPYPPLLAPLVRKSHRNKRLSANLWRVFNGDFKHGGRFYGAEHQLTCSP